MKGEWGGRGDEARAKWSRNESAKGGLRATSHKHGRRNGQYVKQQYSSAAAAWMELESKLWLRKYAFHFRRLGHQGTV